MQVLAEPADPTGRAGGLPGLRLAVSAPSGTIVVYALHVPKPGFDPDHGQSFAADSCRIRAIRDAAALEVWPVVVAGDLNLTDRSPDYRFLRQQLQDTARNGWAGPTSAKASLLWRALLLRIDYILTRGLCSGHGHSFRIPGSDHRGVSTEVGPCQS